jgi:hypothetical protein
VKAAAYVHGPARVVALGQAFAAGCRKLGVECAVVHVKDYRKPDPDVTLTWHYGMGEQRRVFLAYEGRATRIVADKGYFHGYVPKDRPRYFRIAIDSQQADGVLRLREHPLDRFIELGINVRPVAERGQYVLLCGMGMKQAGMVQGIPYGSWERATYAQLRKLTGKPIMAREKPKCPPLTGLPRLGPCPASTAIRRAWAIVCNTGNIGADAVLEGVPVVANAGPGAVYGQRELVGIDALQPLSHDARLAALADIAYWQWTQQEIADGLMLANLIAEGVVA